MSLVSSLSLPLPLYISTWYQSDATRAKGIEYVYAVCFARFTIARKFIVLRRDYCKQ